MFKGVKKLVTASRSLHNSTVD